MRAIFSFLGDLLHNQAIVLFSVVLAIMLLEYPLQKQIEISRLQHYSLAVYLVAFGFLIQLIWSWRALTTWGKVTILSSALYLGSFATYFYSNPWLDSRLSLQTEGQMFELEIYLILFAFTGFIVGIFWICWNIDERKRLTSHENKDAK